MVPDLHSFTVSLFFRKFSDGFFWKKECSQTICFPKGCQKTVNCGTLGKEMLSEWENLLFTSTVYYHHLNHLLHHQTDLLLLTLMGGGLGSGLYTCLKVSWYKIWKKKSKARKQDLGLVKWCHLAYSIIRKLLFIF